jgi:hypothetical protein
MLSVMIRSVVILSVIILNAIMPIVIILFH